MPLKSPEKRKKLAYDLRQRIQNLTLYDPSIDPSSSSTTEAEAEHNNNNSNNNNNKILSYVTSTPRPLPLNQANNPSPAFRKKNELRSSSSLTYLNQYSHHHHHQQQQQQPPLSIDNHNNQNDLIVNYNNQEMYPSSNILIKHQLPLEKYQQDVVQNFNNTGSQRGALKDSGKFAKNMYILFYSFFFINQSLLVYI